MGKVDSAAFAVYEDGKVLVKGRGASFRGNFSGKHKMMPRLFYGWILDAGTREVVWRTFSSKNPLADRRFQGPFEINEEIKLSRGNYILYYTHINAYGHTWNAKKLWKALKVPYEKDQRHEYKLTVSAKGDLLGTKACPNTEQPLKPIVEVTKAGNHFKYEGAFHLSGQTTLNIYALGEGDRHGRELYDHAWIYSATTMQKVWSFNQANISEAGGADKNLMVRDSVTLPEGNYKVYYQTDDSHSHTHWNAKPPWDAAAWGVTVRPATKADAKRVGKFRKKDLPVAVVELIKVGDYAMLSQGLRVKEDVKVRVFAVGERRNEHRMADYGWIVDAITQEVVWEMETSKTQPAGGTRKNRLFNDQIKLPKGDYLVCYRTDDSHSYESWNSGKPFQPERWGISIFASKQDKGKLMPINQDEMTAERTIAKLLRVVNDEELEKTFSLKRDGKVRIIAIGEGEKGHMTDYGWIEDDRTGVVVWEMRYQNTKEAGGAYKNRLFNEVISLPKGKYKLIFRTDDSHAYDDWNAHPPDSPDHYGIMLLAADK